MYPRVIKTCVACQHLGIVPVSMDAQTFIWYSI